MKIPTIATLNSVGFTSPQQKVIFAAQLLKFATLGGAKVIYQKTPEIATPAVAPSLAWKNAIDITAETNDIHDNQNNTIVANRPVISLSVNLPFEATPALIGRPVSTIAIKSIADDKAVPINRWDGTKASQIPETKLQTEEPSTLEQYLYKYAEMCDGFNPSVLGYEISNYPSQVLISVRYFRLHFDTLAGYNLNVEPYQQLDKIGDNLLLVASNFTQI